MNEAKLKLHERECHASYDVRTPGKTYKEAATNSENLIGSTDKNSRLIGLVRNIFVPHRRLFQNRILGLRKSVFTRIDRDKLSLAVGKSGSKLR